MLFLLIENNLVPLYVCVVCMLQWGMRSRHDINFSSLCQRYVNKMKLHLVLTYLSVCVCEPHCLRGIVTEIH